MKRFIGRMAKPQSLPVIKPGPSLGNQRAHVQKTWEELAAPLRSDDLSTALNTYQSLKEIKEQLHRHAEERRAKADEYLNQAKYFNVLASCWLAHIVDLSVDTKEPSPPVLPANVSPDLPWSNVLPQVPRIDALHCKAVKRTLDMKLREFRPDNWEGWNFVKRSAEQEALVQGREHFLDRYDDRRDRYIKYRQNGLRWAWHLYGSSPEIDWALSLRVPNKVLKNFGVDPSALPFPERGGHSEDSSWANVIRRHLHFGWEYKEKSSKEFITAKKIELRLSILKNVLYQFEVFGSVEPLSDEEIDQMAKDQTDENPPITGYSAGEYAVEALEILQENPGITTFSSLAAQWDCGGRAKVDTIKRGIGYDALPKEKKSFNAFKGMLKEKVRLMKRG